MPLKNLIKTGVLLSSVTAGGTYLAFNSVYIDYCKQAMHVYRRGNCIKLSEKLENLCKEVLNEVNLPSDSKKKFNFFASAGFDVFNIGSLHLGNSVYIGLPSHFDISSVEETESLTVFKQPIKWRTNSGRKLQESLILSEDAKKFAIARDIYFCDSNRVYFKSLLISTSVLVPHLLYHAINRRFSEKLLFKHYSVKISAYIICALIGYIFYGVTVDLCTQYYDKIADRRAILLKTANYYDGAIEYYSKMLQRNKALRKMMGEQGSKYFTAEGNDKVYFRRIHLPLTTRISEIEEFQNPFSVRD